MKARRSGVRGAILVALVIGLPGCDQKKGEFFIPTSLLGGETSTEFSVVVSGGFDHPSGGQSFVCVRVTTSPAQPGATYQATVTGPAVDGDGHASGSLDASGTGRFQVLITDIGNYTVAVVVTSGGRTEEASTPVNVTGSGGSCP